MNDDNLNAMLKKISHLKARAGKRKEREKKKVSQYSRTNNSGVLLHLLSTLNLTRVFTGEACSHTCHQAPSQIACKILTSKTQ